jgi:hypothetical protein
MSLGLLQFLMAEKGNHWVGATHTLALSAKIAGALMHFLK